MIIKSFGLNSSEVYLSNICEKTFLSLWSYPNVFKEPGKELCDLLVVVGDSIILFSIKECAYPETSDKQLNWKRWFKRAVENSATQLWSAENFIKRKPQNVFLDSKCEKAFPIPINLNSNTQIHLVLVAFGASEFCKQSIGGKGSLLFSNEIKGLENHRKPFVIGDLDTSKTFVHVLDNHSLDILLSNRDTIKDFEIYLVKRKGVLRGDSIISSPGEEELMAIYLSNLNEEGDHDFIFKVEDKKSNSIAIEEGRWKKFQDNPGRINQIKADEISYMWDGLINSFCKSLLRGDQYYLTTGDFVESELAIRMLALPSRFERRVLAESLRDFLIKRNKDLHSLRVISQGDFYYAFVLVPCPEDFDYAEYRRMRAAYLEAVCLVVKHDYLKAKFVIGIAMESSLKLSRHAEDLIVYDGDKWNEEAQLKAQKLKKDFNILNNSRKIDNDHTEYPL